MLCCVALGHVVLYCVVLCLEEHGVVHSFCSLLRNVYKQAVKNSTHSVSICLHLLTDSIVGNTTQVLLSSHAAPLSKGTFTLANLSTFRLGTVAFTQARFPLEIVGRVNAIKRDKYYHKYFFYFLSTLFCQCSICCKI